jgi:hypothetical protein
MQRKDRPAERPRQGAWLRLSIALQKKMVEPGDRVRALEWFRTELNRSDGNRLRHRYHDREGRPHEDDLPTDLRLEDIRFDDCVLRRGHDKLVTIRAYSIEVLWPEEQSTPPKPPAPARHPGGRPSHDWQGAQAWMREQIAGGAPRATETVWADRVQREYFGARQPHRVPSKERIIKHVVRPVK